MTKEKIQISAFRIAGIYLVTYFLFELMTKLGAQLIGALMTGQLPVAMINGDFIKMIFINGSPFLIMIFTGVLLIALAKNKEQQLASDEAWMASQNDQKRLERMVVGVLILLNGLYGAGTYSMNVLAQLSSGSVPAEMMGMLVKMVLPTYIVFGLEVILGAWALVTGAKQKASIPAEEILVADGTQEEPFQEQSEPEMKTADEEEKAVEASEETQESEQSEKTL